MSDTDDRRRRVAEAYEADPIGVNRQIVDEYRANGGNVAQFGGPSRMLLLTTTGARTGQMRTTPMMYLTDGDRLVVYASNMGSRRHPAWYHNLLAHPDVSVEVGSERFDATAVATDGETRERLWRLFPFPEHQSQTRRQIPVIVLTRRP
ncbi:MAG TPA: nitroreductase family deazaflavin-dependent oxidoreductase [Candidatus Dormibacteraeota bacterium]